MGLGLISPYLITIFLAWAFAHIIKYIISRIRKQKYSLRTHMFISGGMPSAHSAATVGLATVIGLSEGTQSGLFALAALFSLITMYDALKVRRSVGEQGAAIHSLINKIEASIDLPRAAKGHTPLEVLCGAILGFLIGISVFLLGICQ